MLYTTTISPESEYGITAARDAYNASIPALVDDAPNPALLASDSAYLDFVLAAAVQSWCKQYAPVVVPEVPVTSVNGVPQVVTMRQARLALLQAGLLAGIEAAIAGLPEPQKTAALIEWEYSSEVHRGRAFVQTLGGALGLPDAALDALFVAAAKL